jgi:hypothetical protein
MRPVGLVGFILFSFANVAMAAVFGTVRGLIHDPQHRPVPGTNITIKAIDSDYTRTTTTDAEGPPGLT